MDFSHDTMLALAKVWGLFYLFAFSIGVVIYTFWPRNRERFTRAETEIFDKDDIPWT
ncbi:CcoQ/FixQ family Cbb3-type cytochrome c oxidase assembly chaperone [Metarhizobium album]|jgi:cytochrome c oxidase cbb3-type subunit 4|uniref:CcoQ/FixQ family Cbb3-type cytochrome c oxidase assembly chaperone n=1 Tax=Metarhizobium album TaxID=2182425 RepID=A0A2U2DMZ5_9HYPH|nr:cbb3-type cytochrome c oxidase subunit 3 [Rhizobium album]PWE54632.1 CcoQ/FixQ family Cbb3-type cytochrome c oxidase assembly chaperone [Rhizobium album]